MKFVGLGMAGLVLAASPALADSPFDGTWKAKLDSMKRVAKPDTMMLKNGTFTCQTCQPKPYSVPADGQFHAVAGRPYWDEIAINAVDDHSLKLQFRKAGTIISTSTQTVSADGRTMTTVSHNTNNGGNVPIDATGTATRVGAAVTGAHLASGSWDVKPATQVSDAALTMKIKVDGNKFHQEVGLGESLDATIGGAYALNQGDPGKTMTKVERLGPRSLRMTDMRGGKVVNVATYTVAADGTTINGSYRDPQTGETGTMVAMKM